MFWSCWLAVTLFHHMFHFNSLERQISNLVFYKKNNEDASTVYYKIMREHMCQERLKGNFLTQLSDGRFGDSTRRTYYWIVDIGKFSKTWFRATISYVWILGNFPRELLCACSSIRVGLLNVRSPFWSIQSFDTFLTDDPEKNIYQSQFLPEKQQKFDNLQSYSDNSYTKFSFQKVSEI